LRTSVSSAAQLHNAKTTLKTTVNQTELVTNAAWLQPNKCNMLAYVCALHCLMNNWIAVSDLSVYTSPSHHSKPRFGNQILVGHVWSCKGVSTNIKCPLSTVLYCLFTCCYISFLSRDALNSVQSAVLHSHVVRPSVCPSVTLVDHDDIGKFVLLHVKSTFLQQQT